jgi:hypothetical protein
MYAFRVIKHQVLDQVLELVEMSSQHMAPLHISINV